MPQQRELSATSASASDAAASSELPSRKRKRKSDQASKPLSRRSTGPQRLPTHRATVYDAVAGRMGNSHHFQHSRGSRNSAALHPAEVLFSAAGAPPLEPDDTLYDAHLSLPDFAKTRRGADGAGVANEQERLLPSSDLLKALHRYCSRFYAAASEGAAVESARRRVPEAGEVDGHGGGARASRLRAGCDWRSMDETALLAMGVLMEEAAAAALGETGDLVFVEGEMATDEDAEADDTEAEDLETTDTETDDANEDESLTDGATFASGRDSAGTNYQAATDTSDSGGEGRGRPPRRRQSRGITLEGGTDW